jgi:hypothetical protein
MPRPPGGSSRWLLVFSGCDCQILAAALRPIAPAMPMFDVLDRLADEAGGDRFAPFGIGSIDRLFSPSGASTTFAVKSLQFLKWISQRMWSPFQRKPSIPTRLRWTKRSL